MAASANGMRGCSGLESKRSFMVSAALDVVAAIVEITNLQFPHAKLISCWNRVTNIHIYGTMSIWIETPSTPLGLVITITNGILFSPYYVTKKT
jgi:hypothetical protein